MKACVIMYDKMNLLSFARLYEFFYKVKIPAGAAAFKSEIVDEFGVKVSAQIFDQSLDIYDIVAIPSGFGALDLIYNDIFLSWIKTSSKATMKITDDIAALIFGAAGMIKDKDVCIRAGYINALKQYCNAIDLDDYLDDGIFSFREFNEQTRFKLEDLLNNLRNLYKE